MPSFVLNFLTRQSPLSLPPSLRFRCSAPAEAPVNFQLSVCAGQQVHPACARGQVVRIVSAVWGRQSAPDAAQPALFAPADATKCAAPPAHAKPPGGASEWDAIATSQCAVDVSDLVRAQCHLSPNLVGCQVEVGRGGGGGPRFVCDITRFVCDITRQAA